MKKPLSILLIVSTLFLSVGISVCSADVTENNLTSVTTNTENFNEKLEQTQLQNEKIKSLEKQVEELKAELQSKLKNEDEFKENYKRSIKEMYKEKYKDLKMQLKNEKLNKRTTIWGRAKNKFINNVGTAVGNVLTTIFKYTLIAATFIGLAVYGYTSVLNSKL